MRRRALTARRPAGCYPRWRPWANTTYAERMIEYVREFERLNNLVRTI